MGVKEASGRIAIKLYLAVGYWLLAIGMKLAALLVLGTAAVCAAPVEDTIALGRKALANDGVATAWRIAQQALHDAPDSALAHEFAGEVHFRRGEIGEADEEFKSAVEWNPRLALAWFGLARVADCAAMNKTAAEDFRRAYQLDPNNSGIFRAWFPHMKGPEREQALKRYEAMLLAESQHDDGKALHAWHDQEALAKALNGRHPTALASPYKATELPLQAFVSAATHVRTYGLDALVNGQPVRLVLDTGAAGIVLSQGAAQRVGLTRVAGGAVHGIGDNTKLTGGYSAIAPSLRIGDVEYRDALISVADQNFVGIEDGLIGTNVMDEFQMTLDFGARRLRLDPLPNYHPGEDLPDRSVSPQMANAMRVFRFGHLLLVPVGVGNQRERLFVLDTGAASTLISYELAAEVSKLARDDKTALRGVNGRVNDVYQTGNVVLRFAGFEQRNLSMSSFDTWQLSHSLGTEISGFLGLPVLDLFTLTIDYVDGLVKFERRP
jgi:predicted aspartyl protease